jgi:hypothetical protein
VIQNKRTMGGAACGDNLQSTRMETKKTIRHEG